MAQDKGMQNQNQDQDQAAREHKVFNLLRRDRKSATQLARSWESTKHEAKATKKKTKKKAPETEPETRVRVQASSVALTRLNYRIFLYIFISSWSPGASISTYYYYSFYP